MSRSDEGGGCAQKFGNHLARIAIADLDRVVRTFLQQPADQRLRARLRTRLRQDATLYPALYAETASWWSK